MRLSIFLFLLVLTACQHSSAKSSKHILHLNLRIDPPSLDPRLVSTAPALTLMRHLYEGLMRADHTGMLQPALAQHVDISEDGLTYTFYLREAYWKNDSQITSYDFARSWLQTLSATFPCSYAHMLYPIKNAKALRSGYVTAQELGIETPNSYTLIVHLEKPTPYFLELTAFPTLFPVHIQQTDTECFCSGPFQLVSWEPTYKLILEKNNNYWDAEHVYLQGIELSVVSDNTTESYLYQRGELDWLGQPISNNISTELISLLRQKGLLKSYDVDGTCWLKINVEKPPFDSLLIRKAFALALNRQLMISHLLQGNQKIATSPIPPSMTLQHTPFFQDGDVKTAQCLFEQALRERNWTRDTLPSITLCYTPKERMNKLVVLIQQQWQEAFHIPIHLQAIEEHIFRKETCLGHFQIGPGDWIADYHDPLSFLELFKDKNVEGLGMNDTMWHNEYYSCLLERSSNEPDPVQRRVLLEEAEKLLMDNMPIIPLYHYCFDYVKREGVENVVLSPLGLADFKSVSLH